MCLLRTGVGTAYFDSEFASSVAKALLGSCSRSRRFGLLPPPPLLPLPLLPVRPLVFGWSRTGVACWVGGELLPLEGCAGLARSSLSSSGARSKRRIIACISSGVGASTNANPLDSCVSWLRITFTESATRSSAASHCLISSAVTHMGRLPRKTVKLIQWFSLLRCWIVLQKEGSDLCQFDSSRPRKSLQTKKPLCRWKSLGKYASGPSNTGLGIP